MRTLSPIDGLPHNEKVTMAVKGPELQSRAGDRSYHIEVIINRTLVYGALALFVGAVYVAVVVGLGRLIGSQGEPNTVLAIVATVVVAVVFQPLKERVQRLANRLVYGERTTPYEAVTRFSEHMAASYGGSEMLTRMAEVVARGTGAEQVNVWLRVGDQLRAAAGWPESESPFPQAIRGNDLPQFPGTDRAIAIYQHEELLGAITVVKRPGEPLTPVEDKLLSDLASQAGLVLENMTLTAELEARLDQITIQAAELRVSRARIVAAHDGERRRLERNIHDGAQQHLVALAVKLGLAKTLATQDREKAENLVQDLRAEIDLTMDTLKDLVTGIYPQVLIEHGLVIALGRQTAHASVPVVMRASLVRRYPDEIEAAVFFCCLEAIQNAAKYAEAEQVTVEVWEEDGLLAFKVSDDGAGFDPRDITSGSGLQNMVDRIETAGGRLVVQSAPGQGTTISGRVPVGVVEALT
jgi:signal transduction histidine kinase